MDDLLAWPGGPLLVLGGPGTGKTTLVANAIARRIAEGLAPALVLTSSRQAASELRDRVVLAAGRASLQPAIMTVHALCLSLVRRYGDPEDAAPRLLTAPEQEFRIRELLAGWGVERWPDGLARAAGTGTFARQVRSVLARARMLGLDPDDVIEQGRAAGEPAWQVLGEFADEYLAVLDLEGVLDYAELVHRARILLARPAVADAVRAQYSAVYVDELAELDPAQLALVRALAPVDGTVIGLADPDTAIYRFRGADPRATTEFRRLFARPEGEVPVIVLRESHRLGADILAATAQVAARLGAPALGAAEITAYRTPAPRPGPSRVDAWVFESEGDQAARIAAELRAAHLDDGVAWGDMAVLVRSGRRQLPPVARALVDAGIPVEVAGDEIGLADELAVRPLLLALDVAGRGGQCDPDEAARLLSSGWGGLDAVSLRLVGRVLRAGRPAVRGADAVAAALAGSAPFPEEIPQAAQEACETVAARGALLAEAVALVAAGSRPDEVLWHLWSRVDWPDRLRAAALRGGDAARRAHRDLDAVVALFALATASQAPGGPAGIRAFLAEVAEQQIPADVEREGAVRGRGVRLLTAHRAKGRAWAFVVVAGVQEGAWPDVRRSGSIFDPERLGPDGLGEGTQTRDLVATERRLFLLACSRARHRLLVTAVAGNEGEADQPSRFVTELGVDVRTVEPRPARLHTVRALVTSLRAASVDPEASPGLRHAAAARLAHLADATDDEGRPLVPDADPARWWGLRAPSSPIEAPADGPFDLSPSQLGSLLSCPRKYFLEREARADGPRGSGAVLGTVIHLLAEHAASKRLTLEDATARLDEVWSEIPFAAAWLSESERVEATNAVARLIAWQEAHDPADVVGSEVPFAFEIDVDGHRVRIKGSVDRLERRDDGTLRVVDFKSSRRAPSKADVEGHEQLGLYQLAVESGAFDEVARGASGSAGGVLVFLRDGDEYPKALGQPPLRERPYLGDDPDEQRYPTWVHRRLAVACGRLAAGRWDAHPGGHCQYCPFAGSCPARSRQVTA